MRKVAGVLGVLAALVVAAPAAANDDGTISVGSDGIGGLSAFVDNGEPQFDELGLAIRVGSTNYGTGGTTEFTNVDGPNERGSTIETQYKTPELDITESVSLSANTFTVQYSISNSTSGTVTFEPKMLADLAPGGDTQGIGVSSPGIGARSADSNSFVTASGPSWKSSQEGDYSDLKTTALSGGSFTDGAIDTSPHDAGLGIDFGGTVNLGGSGSVSYTATFTLARTLLVEPLFDSQTAGSPETINVAAFDSRGAADPSAHVVYRIDGANPHDVTSVSGAAVTYTGTNRGSDEVHIWKDATANGVLDPGEPEQVARIDWHTPPQPPQAATDLAAAMSAQSGLVSGASYVAAPPGNVDLGPADSVFGSTLDGFPLNGSTFALLTNGDASSAPAGGMVSGGDANGGATRGANDATILKVDLDVPGGASCVSFDFRFLSSEIPGPFNDAFVAELDNDDWSVDPSDVISAPHNFAFDPAGHPITVNGTDVTDATTANAAGTNYHLATGILRASTPVTPGAHSVYFSIFDIRDSIVDSAAFVDNLHTSALPPDKCQPGVIDAASAPSESPPVSTPTTPSGQTTAATSLTLDGEPTDLTGNTHTVTALVRSGNGLPGAHVVWSVAGVNPAQGEATTDSRGFASIAWKGAHAGRDQLVAFADLNGNGVQDGGEVAAANTVDWLAPPVVGKTVNAAPVEGTVLVKLPNGFKGKSKLSPAATNGFVPLAMATQVPVGSTFDTTRGRVQMQTAQTAGNNVKTQSGEFYQGVFQFTQPKGKNPITTLTLNGQLDCTPAKVVAAKKKVRSRSLWGSDHGGRFRTRGRNSSATVRGTEWLTKDSCTTTTTVVRKGSVTVQDFGKRKTVVVKQGHKYVARARAAKKNKRK